MTDDPARSSLIFDAPPPLRMQMYAKDGVDKKLKHTLRHRHGRRLWLLDKR